MAIYNTNYECLSNLPVKICLERGNVWNSSACHLILQFSVIIFTFRPWRNLSFLFHAHSPACDSYSGCYLRDIVKILTEHAKTLGKQGLVPPNFVLVISFICESHPTMSLHLCVIHPGMEPKLGEHRTRCCCCSLGEKWHCCYFLGEKWPCCCFLETNGLAWPCLSPWPGGGWQGAVSSSCHLSCSLGALQNRAWAGKNQINCLGVADSCRSHGPDWCLDKYFIFSHWGDKKMHFFFPRLQLVLY